MANPNTIARDLTAIHEQGPTLIPSDDSENTEDSVNFTISLAILAQIDGNILYDDGHTFAVVNHLYVDDEIRRQGLGTRLLKSFFRFAADQGAESVRSCVINHHALLLRQKLFPEQSQHFFHQQGDEEIELPITIGQACMSLLRAQRLQDSLRAQGNHGAANEVDIGLLVEVPLGEIAIGNDWELPTLAQPPATSRSSATVFEPRTP